MRTDSSPGTLPAREHLPAMDAGTPVLDVVIPVHNEEKDLRPCVRRLRDHLGRTFPYPFRITVADNASTDATPRESRRLAAEFPEHPPYGGRFEPVPHLTVDLLADDVTVDSTLALLGDVLPARCRAERLDLAWYAPHGSHVFASWPLG